MSQLARPSELPDVVEAKLRTVRRRARMLRTAAGFMVTVTVLLLVMMAAMAIDWLVVLFDPAWRTVMTVSTLVVSAGVCAWWCIRPLVRRYVLSSVARAVDRSVPSLEERWSTVTELAASTDPPELRGAESLIQRVSQEAARLNHLVQPGQVAPTRRVHRYWYVLAAALAVLGLAFVLAPGRTGVLIRRFWAPGNDITMTRIASLTGNQVVARREPLVLEANTHGRKPDSASLSIRGSQGQRRVSLRRLTHSPGSADADAAFSYKVRSVEGSFEYRFRSGDGQTPWHTITAVDRPGIAEVRFRIVPPAYSKLATDQRNALPRRCRALQGSRLELAFRATQQLERMELTFDKDPVEALKTTGQRWYGYETVLDQNVSFSVRLVNEYGLANLVPPACRVVVYPDRPPSVDIVSPEPEIVIPPDEERIETVIEARDDLGIHSLEMVVTVKKGEHQEETAISIPLGPDQGAKKVRRKVQLDLRQFDLQHGSELSYAARVRDTRLATVMSEPSGKPTEGSDGDSEKSRSPDQDEPPGGKSAPRPPDNMTRRPLDIGQCTACSKKHRILVDKWADSFDGQARDKLRIQIDKYLQRLDAALAAAQVSTDELLDHVRSNGPWQEAQANKLSGARENLTDADKTIVELKTRSANTPYAFIGLQLDQIGFSHVNPARKHLAEAGGLKDQPVARLSELDRASYHIARAREKLAALTRQYQAVKRQEKLAEAMARFAKMHQLFIEDMYAFLKSSRPRLNQRPPRGYAEVDEEYVRKLRAKYERLKELLAELSKALAEDPDLLRRYLAMMRMEGITIRDQLSILAQRQEALRHQLGRWIEAGDAGSPEVQVKLAQAQLAEQREVAELAAQLHDNTVTWMPRNVDASKGPLARCRKLADEAARLTREVVRQMEADRPNDALVVATEVIGKLEAFHAAAADAVPEQDGDHKITIFVANRLAESEKVLARQAGWIHKVEAVREGKKGRAAAIDQDRLRLDTAEFAVKLERVTAMVSGLPQPVRAKARELEHTVGHEVMSHQSSAAAALKTEKLQAGHKDESGAVASFARAENLFDELLTMIEQHLPKKPCGPCCGVPTLENLLAMLENECKACEKLGLACLQVNVALQMDWAMPGSGSCKPGSGSGNQQGTSNRPARTAHSQARAAGKYAERAAREMEKALKNTLAAANQLAKTMWPKGQPGEDGSPAGAHGNNGPDFNVLVSELEKQLQHARDNVPPEQYRELIERYFHTLSSQLANASP